MITYSVVSFKDYRELLAPLFYEHWKDLGLFKGKIGFNPDYNKYEVLEDIGSLHTAVASENGVPVGYFISFIHEYIHSKGCIFAANDALYISPDYRGRGVGENLFRFVEEELKGIGVSVISFSVKPYNRFDSLCEKLGYEESEISFSKYIGE